VKISPPKPTKRWACCGGEKEGETTGVKTKKPAEISCWL
jgi:hypothetical protein